MHEIPKEVVKMWESVNRTIETERSRALNTERLFFEVKNWTPVTLPLTIVDLNYIVVKDWPRDLDPQVLARGLDGRSGRRYTNFIMIETNLGTVEIQFAPLP